MTHFFSSFFASGFAEVGVGGAATCLAGAGGGSGILLQVGSPAPSTAKFAFVPHASRNAVTAVFNISRAFSALL